MMTLTKEQLDWLKAKYYIHKCNHRKIIREQNLSITYTLTFDEFADIWISSGKVFQMGLRRGGAVMMRREHKGNFEYANMIISTLDVSTTVRHKGTQKNRGNPINQGIKRSAHTKALQSANRLGKPRPECGRAIQTPMGLFQNIQEAAAHYGIRPEGIHYFKRKYPTEYYYI